MNIGTCGGRNWCLICGLYVTGVSQPRHSTAVNKDMNEILQRQRHKINNVTQQKLAQTQRRMDSKNGHSTYHDPIAVDDNNHMKYVNNAASISIHIQKQNL